MSFRVFVDVDADEVISERSANDSSTPRSPSPKNINNYAFRQGKSLCITSLSSHNRPKYARAWCFHKLTDRDRSVQFLLLFHYISEPIPVSERF